jgi:hypothetical protein
MRQSRLSFLFGSASLSLATVALLAGCGDSGPEKYEVTGQVLCAGTPVKSGDIFFEPKDSLANNQTMGRALIKDGRYTGQIVGGVHKISVREFTGDIDLDPQGAMSGAKPVLRIEWRGEVEFPPLSEVDGSAPIEKDIEIPDRYCRK